LTDHSFAYLQCIRVRSVGLNNVDIAPPDFSGNLGLDGGLVADEPEDGVGWVFRELAEGLELHNGFFVLVKSLVHEVG
jgi:hypothetical protein